MAEQTKTPEELTAEKAAAEKAAAEKAAAEKAAAEKAAAEKAAAEKAANITVRVNDKIAAYGGSFYEPELKLDIGVKPIKVKKTAFVKAKLLTEELVEV